MIKIIKNLNYGSIYAYKILEFNLKRIILIKNKNPKRIIELFISKCNYLYTSFYENKINFTYRIWRLFNSFKK